MSWKNLISNSREVVTIHISTQKNLSIEHVHHFSWHLLLTCAAVIIVQSIVYKYMLLANGLGINVYLAYALGYCSIFMGNESKIMHPLARETTIMFFSTLFSTYNFNYEYLILVG